MFVGPDILIAVGASAGGVEALRRFVSGLPADLPAAVLVVLHIPPDRPSRLALILDRAGPLPATTASHGETLRHGIIYTAPPDHHLLAVDNTANLTTEAREHSCRPAIDPLFRSTAGTAGPQAVGVVLSGLLHDGPAGLRAIRECGGTILVQDPADARFPALPRNAIRTARPDHIATATELGQLVGALTRALPSERATDGIAGIDSTGPGALRPAATRPAAPG